MKSSILKVVAITLVLFALRKVLMDFSMDFPSKPKTLVNMTRMEKKLETKYETLGRSLRLFKSISLQISAGNEEESPKTRETMSQTADILERMLFPWLKPRSLALGLKKGLADKGIVICSNNNMMQFTMTTITIIRQIHQSNIPIQVFYMGEKDLGKKNRERLHVIPNVETIDITKVFNNDILKLKGFAIKPFALLASSFENAILMDADTILLQKPEEFFNQPEYIKTGTLFFNDRSLRNDMKDWGRARKMAVELVGNYTSSLEKLRFFSSPSDKTNPRTNYQMESGVVVMNKSKRFFGLLSTCMLNFGEIGDEMYRVTHGDKETFWIGFEAVGEPYAFSSHLAGVLGPANIPATDGSSKTAVCGHQILHFDFKGNPFWFNGSLHRVKGHTQSYLVADIYTEEDLNQHWNFAHNAYCLFTANPKELSTDQRNTITKGIEIMDKIQAYLSRG